MNKRLRPAALLGDWLAHQNNDLTLRRYRLRRGLPRPVRIVQLADLHGKRFPPQNQPLLSLVERARPHLIVLTGDTVSASCRHLAATAALVGRLAALAPVAVIAGNHEQRSRRCDEIMARFAAQGALVLRDQLATLELAGQPAHLLGLCEPQAISRRDYLDAALGTLTYADNRPLLAQLAARTGIRLVLSHFPENFACIGPLSYNRCDFDVMFAGHAHGGQFRLPYIGGLYAPGQGFFPLYDAGLYGGRAGRPALVLSRGLGNDSFLPRVNNRPEVVELILY